MTESLLNFRDEHARITATLVRKFGPQHLDSILDATQEAFLAALQSWPLQGEPTNPAAWLTTAAERRLIDHLRKTRRETELPEQEPPAPDSSIPAEHDELRLYFLLCSPKLKFSEQVCLILRTLGGLTSLEIARLLHESEEAVQRRISRAKNKLNPEDLEVHDPEGSLPTVLLALYLLFTEGYEATRGEDYLRADLAVEALRLTQQLANLTGNNNPNFHALLALMHFNISRLPARTNQDGLPILLKDQDPVLYDRSHIAAGFYHIERAQAATELSRYHLEAGLAASIASGATTKELLYWHELLIERFPNPLSQLSHAIAIGTHHGPQRGLDALHDLKSDPRITKTPHYYSAFGHFYAELGNRKSAAAAYKKAIGLTMSIPTKISLEQRYAELIEPAQ
ncbi:MAG: RNA polymerase sigma factor [Fimbriimonadaceae bacterium]